MDKKSILKKAIVCTLAVAVIGLSTALGIVVTQNKDNENPVITETVSEYGVGVPYMQQDGVNFQKFESSFLNIHGQLIIPDAQKLKLYSSSSSGDFYSLVLDDNNSLFLRSFKTTHDLSSESEMDQIIKERDNSINNNLFVLPLPTQDISLDGVKYNKNGFTGANPFASNYRVSNPIKTWVSYPTMSRQIGNNRASTYQILILYSTDGEYQLITAEKIVNTDDLFPDGEEIYKKSLSYSGVHEERFNLGRFARGREIANPIVKPSSQTSINKPNYSYSIYDYADIETFANTKDFE